MDIAAVRAALATAAESAAGTTGLTCLPYVPDSITPPCFFVGEYSIDYTDEAATFGAYPVVFTCRVLVSRSDDLSGQALLDGFLGDGDQSLRAALEAVAAYDVFVRAVTGYGAYEIGTERYVGADLVVQVLGGDD